MIILFTYDQMVRRMENLKKNGMMLEWTVKLNGDYGKKIANPINGDS